MAFRELSAALNVDYLDRGLGPNGVFSKSNARSRRVYRAKLVSWSQPGRRQVFGDPTTQIMVFRAIQLKPLLPVQLICNCKVFSIVL